MRLNANKFSKIDSFVGNSSSQVLAAYRPCPICGKLKSDNVITIDDFQFFSDSAELPKRTQVSVVQCRHCHALYLNPCYTPTGFGYLFEEAGQSYGSTADRQIEQVEWITVRGLLEKCTVFLDVGCYDGTFLRHLPNYVRRIGVDIDKSAIDRGNSRLFGYGIEFMHSPFESFRCPEKPDVISMFHVLEHLSNPFEVLSNLCALSHSNTCLIIEVPVIEHGKTNDINGFFSVQHMTHFSLKSLAELMSRTGWDIIERTQMEGYNGHRLLAKPGIASIEVVGDVYDRIHLYKYLEHWYRSLAEISVKIDTLASISRMVIWGGGMHTEFLYQKTSLFFQNPLREYQIVDSDPLKQGKSWRGIRIDSPDSLSNFDWSETKLLISSYGGQEVIAESANNIGVPEESVFRLYKNIMVY